jgi:hypothetical protein
LVLPAVVLGAANQTSRHILTVALAAHLVMFQGLLAERMLEL